MGTPLGPKYIPYTYMDPLGIHHMPRLRFAQGTRNQGDTAKCLDGRDEVVESIPLLGGSGGPST